MFTLVFLNQVYPGLYKVVRGQIGPVRTGTTSLDVLRRLIVVVTAKLLMGKR